MKWSTVKKLAALLFYSIVQLMPSYGVSTESKESRMNPAQSVSQARLSIRADKTEYKLGEPIQLSIQLENIGNEPIYIHFALELDSAISGSYMKLDIFNSDGKLIPYVQHVSDSAPLGDHPNGIEGIIRANYHLLNPKYFYGKTTAIYPKLRGITQEGRYKLIITYYNTMPAKWSAEEKASLKYYVVGGKLESNEVWVEIVP